MVAGDIFDDGWRPHRCPPELINFALRHLPVCYAVPGQHDLPHHRYEDIEKSAYYTLLKAGRIINLPPASTLSPTPKLELTGFPWGITPAPRKPPKPGVVALAVVHSYIWDGTVDSKLKEGTGYAGAPEDKTVRKFGKTLDGFTTAVFGDNHIAFSAKTASGTNVFNCGGFMVRRSNEVGEHIPRVGLLTESGQVMHFPLDISKDVYTPVGDAMLTNDGDFEAGVVADTFNKLGEVMLDFREALKVASEQKGLKPKVWSVIQEILQAVKESK